MYGAGLQHAISEIDEDVILNKTESHNRSPTRDLHLETLIQAKPGEKNIGETILKLFLERSKVKTTWQGWQKKLMLTSKLLFP